MQTQAVFADGMLDLLFRNWLVRDAA